MTEEKSKDKFFQGVGKRKCAIATVHLIKKNGGEITVNGQKIEKYIKRKELISLINKPLILTDQNGRFEITAKVNGGGPSAWAEAIRLGIARALIVFDPELRKKLKIEGLLKRDARIKERKKPGHKRARRSPQWSKR